MDYGTRQVCTFALQAGEGAKVNCAVRLCPKTRYPKHEIRNKFEARKRKLETSLCPACFEFRISNLFRISIFVLRVSGQAALSCQLTGSEHPARQPEFPTDTVSAPESPLLVSPQPSPSSPLAPVPSDAAGP